MSTRAPLMRGSRPAVLATTLLVDAVLGEPPPALHPVVWMGRGIGCCIPADPPRAGRAVLLRGAVVAAGGAALCGLVGGAAAAGARRLDGRLSVALEAAALWPLLALRSLTDAAARVRSALDAGDLDLARAELRWLVSRETGGLTAPLLASAAVESLAENLGDAVVAPLLAAAVAGPAGAAAHRFVNTADAMVGYPDRFHLGGRAAARFDDVLGALPAWLSALAIAAAVPLAGGSGAAALRCLREDGGRTASPNSGRPMAAMAGGLGIRLEKRGHHVLNAAGRPPRPEDIDRAVRSVRAATALIVAAAAAGLAGARPRRWRRRAPAAL